MYTTEQDMEQRLRSCRKSPLERTPSRACRSKAMNWKSVSYLTITITLSPRCLVLPFTLL
jgi:hypothetical protein